jgi:hypothetical protein
MVRHTGRNDLRKNQEVGVYIFRRVNFLGLSSGQVADHRKLFLDAIDWYVRSLVQENKQDGFYLDNPDYSLLHLLRKRVESAKELRDSSETKLLKLILNQYQGHLDSLKLKPWIRQDAVQRELDELSVLAQIDMVNARKK